ncbi:hypothetical protein ANN_09106 [Periplaneta americana]|uniref:Peptidase S1 domain-containing protein n=1 Tax=Periplaneta americana TaxID=6978 RepID=A0ABQ8TMH4_PERAM|nr:hypothetical protein ANN_09106 [Periplaneta americana]
MMRNLILLAILVAADTQGKTIRRIPIVRDSRIINGVDASPGEFPSQLSLQRPTSHSCGASILSENWALTAAHCVDGSSTSSITLYAGSIHLSIGGTRHYVSQIIVHENYDEYDSWINDIAVIKKCEKIVRNVQQWRTNVHDETRPGRPSLITEDLKTKVNDRILQDRRTSLDELHIAFPDISRSLLGEIVSQHLGLHKICARWVPRQLSDQHKTQRMASALTFLMRYHTDGDAFLDQIVTADETWMSHNTPETKRQSRQWHHPSSPKKPRKFKQTLSTQKVMATVFGIVSNPFKIDGVNVNPVSLPAQGKNPADGSTATVIGWGRLYTGGPIPNNLQKVDIAIVNQKECNTVYGNMNYPIYDGQICADVPQGNQGSCNGDSGGPLFVDGTVVGLVSWANGCATPGYPTVYTRVSAYRDWIKQKTGV